MRQVVSNKLLYVIIAVLVFGFCNFLSPRLESNLVLAGETPPKALDWQAPLKEVGSPAYGKGPAETKFLDTVGGIIQVIIALAGVLILLLFLYGGFLWMTAGGNEEQIKKAKGLIRDAVIGLIIVLVAYAATYFIIERLTSVA